MLHARSVGRSLGHRPLLSEFLLGKADILEFGKLNAPKTASLGANGMMALWWWVGPVKFRWGRDANTSTPP